MVSVRNLSVKYGSKVVLDDINLSFNGGDKIAIIGKNGSGKTTFVETLMGLNKPFKGIIEISDDLKKKTKCVFQDIDYDNELTLSELLYFYSKLSGLDKIDNQIFDKYELGNVKKKKFRSLSGGEKQKFKLLLCLEFNPELIILDELTTSLDYQWRIDIIKDINNYLDIHKSAILILVSHDPKEIKKLCNKFYLVKDKKINQIDNIDAFFGNE